MGTFPKLQTAQVSPKPHAEWRRWQETCYAPGSPGHVTAGPSTSTRSFGPAVPLDDCSAQARDDFEKSQNVTQHLYQPSLNALDGCFSLQFDRPARNQNPLSVPTCFSVCISVCCHDHDFTQKMICGCFDLPPSGTWFLRYAVQVHVIPTVRHFWIMIWLLGLFS